FEISSMQPDSRSYPDEEDDSSRTQPSVAGRWARAGLACADTCSTGLAATGILRIHSFWNEYIHRSGMGESRGSPDNFNPTALDCRRGARGVKDAGMKGMIITAKDPECFWLGPSQSTTSPL